MFHRLWLPYTLYPWKLAGLLDSESSVHTKTLLATEFLELDVCCLNSWWGKPLRDRATTAADLVDGSCTTLLKGMFNGKIFNIEVETNFARMQSMKRVGRGREDLASSLSAKHCLAEAKLSYVRDIKKNHVKDQSHDDENVDGQGLKKKQKTRFEFVSSSVFIHNISGSPNAKHCMAPWVITIIITLISS
jgi:hypothetical protein